MGGAGCTPGDMRQWAGMRPPAATVSGRCSWTRCSGSSMHQPSHVHPARCMPPPPPAGRSGAGCHSSAPRAPSDGTRKSAATAAAEQRPRPLQSDGRTAIQAKRRTRLNMAATAHAPQRRHATAGATPTVCPTSTPCSESGSPCHCPLPLSSHPPARGQQQGVAQGGKGRTALGHMCARPTGRLAAGKPGRCGAAVPAPACRSWPAPPPGEYGGRLRRKPKAGCRLSGNAGGHRQRNRRRYCARRTGPTIGGGA